MRDYHKENHESALHELYKAIAMLINILKNQYGAVSATLQDQKYSDVELDDVMRMRL